MNASGEQKKRRPRNPRALVITGRKANPEIGLRQISERADDGRVAHRVEIEVPDLQVDAATGERLRHSLSVYASRTSLSGSPEPVRWLLRGTQRLSGEVVFDVYDPAGYPRGILRLGVQHGYSSRTRIEAETTGDVVCRFGANRGSPALCWFIVGLRAGVLRP